MFYNVLIEQVHYRLFFNFCQRMAIKENIVNSMSFIFRAKSKKHSYYYKKRGRPSGRPAFLLFLYIFVER